MKSLSIEKMEGVEGGGVVGCAGIVIGAIGIAALFMAAAPITLGASIWLGAQALAAGLGTGFAIADCAS